MDAQSETPDMFDAEAFDAFERAAGHARAAVAAMADGVAALQHTPHNRVEAERTLTLCRFIHARVQGMAQAIGAGRPKL